MSDKSRLLNVTITFVKLAYIFALAAAVILPSITLAAAFFPGLFSLHGFRVEAAGMGIDLSSGVDLTTWRTGVIASCAIGSVLAFAMLYVFDQLKRLLQNVTAGVPFTDDSAARIRRMGMVIVAAALLEAIGTYGMGTYFYRHIFIPGIELRPVLHLPFTMVVVGLVIICLAEAFRHGARLQEEHDLTV